jgi:hypothetical protein
LRAIIIMPDDYADLDCSIENLLAKQSEDLNIKLQAVENEHATGLEEDDAEEEGGREPRQEQDVGNKRDPDRWSGGDSDEDRGTPGAAEQEQKSEDLRLQVQNFCFGPGPFLEKDMPGIIEKNLTLVLFWPLTHPPTTGVTDFFLAGP